MLADTRLLRRHRSTDGRTLNQAYIECSSRSAARKIVRLRDGVKLCNRPVHVSIASQGELLGTIRRCFRASRRRGGPSQAGSDADDGPDASAQVFPSYRPGFTGVEPNAPLRKNAMPVPLLVQTELTGLLNLCRLEVRRFPLYFLHVSCEEDANGRTETRSRTTRGRCPNGRS